MNSKSRGKRARAGKTSLGLTSRGSLPVLPTQAADEKSSPLGIKRVTAALIWQEGKLLICQRTRHQPRPLKWEFPGGKIEPGEQPRDALRRELDEELGIQAVIGQEVARIWHQYPNHSPVELRFFEVRRYAGTIENRIFRDVRWERPTALPGYDFLEADRELVEGLAEGKWSH